MAKNTGRGSRYAADSPTSGRFLAAKAQGGNFGKKTFWQKLFGRKPKTVVPKPGEWCYVQHGSPYGGQWNAIPHKHPQARPAGSTIKPPR